MRSPRLFPGPGCLLLSVAVILPACSGTSDSGLGPPPRDGLIMYHEPVPQSGLARKRTFQPITQIFMTGEGELAEDGAYQIRAGSIEGAGDTRTTSERDSRRIAREIFQSAGRDATLVLSAERFADLWRRLEEAGLFGLPRHEGANAPRQEPYFLVKTSGRTVYFQRPIVGAVRPDDPGVQQVRYWQQSKIVFFNFLNEL